jgi:hypothetical protein
MSPVTEVNANLFSDIALASGPLPAFIKTTVIAEATVLS